MEYRLCFPKALLPTLIFGAVLPFIISAEKSFIANEFQSDNYTAYRLPKEIIPVSYDLRIDTRLGLNNFTYQGSANITLKVLEATNTIVVHNDGLIVQQQKTLLYQQMGEMKDSITFVVNNQRYDKERQFYIMRFSTLLKPGLYTLILQFQGEVRNDVFGFYRSSYVDNGETKWMGVTQFSPTYARRAFPCMDEPHLKAYFSLRIGHVGNQMVTSNTGIESIIKNLDNTNYYVTTFLRTPRMSTYLVGWAVHDFTSETSNSSKSFKMWTRRSMNGRGSISLNQGLSIYSFLKSLFQIENPISKMDQVAVADFNFHAMENWGMITYRETVVLFENGVTPTNYIIDGFTTMAHEYAHTWFGNLVTPKFWNVAWLKEGFASYFQYFAVAMVQPSWRMMDKFVVDMLQPTLILDAANHTRVMNGRNVGSPSSIMAVLDFVSYKKGASVIRMLSHVIGDSAFQDGLRSYLKHMSYEAASPFDLYEHLQVSSDKSGQLQSNILIKNIMESWTTQPGFPLLTITRNYIKKTVTVSQQRFYGDNNSSVADHETSKWWIPLNFVKQSSITDFSYTAAREWLRPENKNFTIDSIPSEDWIIFNIQQIGYYRVNYDEKNWQMLINYLQSEDYQKIHRINRATLIDDAFNLARGGYIDYTIPLNLSSYLVQESEYEPWVAATNSFKFLNKMLSGAPNVHRAFQDIVELIVLTFYNRNFLTYDGNDVSVAAKIFCGRKISQASKYMKSDRRNNSFGDKWENRDLKLRPVPYKEILLQDVKSFVYCEGIRNGSEKVWYMVWDKLMLTDLHTEQELLLQGLGCTHRTNLIDKFLELSLSEEYGVRKQYRTTIFNAVLNGDIRNVDHTLQFVQYNFQRIIDLRGYDFLDKMITAIGNAMTTNEQTAKLRSFVNENIDKFGTALNGAKEAIAASSRNVEWIAKYSPSIAKILC